MFHTGQYNGVNNFEARQEFMNNEQLKVMYEVRKFFVALVLRSEYVDRVSNRTFIRLPQNTILLSCDELYKLDLESIFS